MPVKKSSKTTKATKKAKNVVKKKSPSPKKRTVTVSERLHDKNVQAGIVVVLLGFTFLLLLVTYFGSN